ncbi:ADP-ribosylglycohydrolase family protein [Agreia pratensis]|nr:ADP-ribosylglycohydrolase family protein [Agreia pratensis]
MSAAMPFGHEVTAHAAALGELLATRIRFDYNGGAIHGKDFRKWMGEDGFGGDDGTGVAEWERAMRHQAQILLDIADLFDGTDLALDEATVTLSFASGGVVAVAFEIGRKIVRIGSAKQLTTVADFSGNEVYARVLLVLAATAAGIPVLEGPLRPRQPLTISPSTHPWSPGWVVEPPAGIVGFWPVAEDEEKARLVALAGAMSVDDTIAYITQNSLEQHVRRSSPWPGRVSRVRGSLLGGAVGDALGFPVEFDSLAALTNRAGGAVRDYLPISGLPDGAISDDTQMTLFTADAISRLLDGGDGSTSLRDAEAEAYLDWYDTQLGGSLGRAVSAPADSLLAERWLYSRRAPGTTIMGALDRAASRAVGTPVPDAVNDSKGCGTVMRSAPFGLVADWTPDEAARHSADAARITHGHATAAASAGVFSRIVRLLLAGGDLQQSVFAGLLSLEVRTGLYSDEATAKALSWALHAATTGVPSPQRIEEFGGGWIAEEALGIAVYCALVYPREHQILDALALAVSHSGDSDSTGAICGNLLGALHGEEALPAGLVARLEGLPTITRVADALSAA